MYLILYTFCRIQQPLLYRVCGCNPIVSSIGANLIMRRFFRSLFYSISQLIGASFSITSKKEKDLLVARGIGRRLNKRELLRTSGTVNLVYQVDTLGLHKLLLLFSFPELFSPKSRMEIDSSIHQTIMCFQ